MGVLSATAGGDGAVLSKASRSKVGRSKVGRSKAGEAQARPKTVAAGSSWEETARRIVDAARAP